MFDINHKKIVFLASAVLFIAAIVFAGCTGTNSQKIEQETAVPTPTPTLVAEITESQPSPEDLDWIVWRENSNDVTLKALWGYFVFSPNVNGQKFKALKIKVTANHPITVLFLNDKELSNFKNKIATNAGEFTPIERYDDVNYKEIEVYSEEYLNIVLWNQKDKIVTANVDIWYKNLV
ncbi:hypothetical protein L1994_00030 [Methanomicrobium antiquum]|uniref:Lipoprotein n=1 Tax=Methanomicrobium antiquum TaxID=487686 RepID=A0AAF0JMV8_9EURY|nr:hypothetical protein [Methanomicrobium antiquum]WFN36821.1 hypothetical protein L1994_00030 [Methanomicrobium antiquum]